MFLKIVIIREMEVRDAHQLWAIAGPVGKADLEAEASNQLQIRGWLWPSLRNLMRVTSLLLKMLSTWRPIWSLQTNLLRRWPFRSKTLQTKSLRWDSSRILEKIVVWQTLTILENGVGATYPDAEWLIDTKVNWSCEHWPVTNSRTVFSTLIAKISTSMSTRPIITKNWSLRTWDTINILTGQDPHLTISSHAKALKSHVHL